MQKFKTIKVVLPIVGAAAIATSFVIPTIVLTTMDTRYSVSTEEYPEGWYLKSGIHSGRDRQGVI